MTPRRHLQIEITAAEHGATACELLAGRAGLSKTRVKDAMAKGAVWLRRRKGKRQRLRRATTVPAAGEVLELFYDQALLNRRPPAAVCLLAEAHYSVWDKPAGLLAQGNEYGDHCSLLRQAELALRRPAYLVHRLDREAAGLMLIAHSRAGAAELSRLFREQRITKHYRVRVRGRVGESHGTISKPLDGKPAVTVYSLLHYDAETDSSLLLVDLKTGRLHQIRRHLAQLGFPVLGDPRYGRANTGKGDLQLEAVKLAFRCPFSGRQRSFSRSA
mgnify:CR=1 FL=1